MNMEEFINQCRYNDNESSQHVHHHLSCEMVYVQEGGALFVVGDKAYHARSGSIMFINCMEQHSVMIEKTPYRRFFATVNPTRLEKEIPGLLSSVFKNRPDGFRHCIDLSQEGDYPLHLFQRLLTEYETPSFRSQDMAKNILEQLLILVYRARPENFVAYKTGSAARVAEIQRYIEEHFTEEIAIPDLAARYFFNPYYLSHCFKEQVGFSPKQYILRIRLSYAKELLETTSLQINQIAYQSGFGDANNFIRAFKAAFGVSPNQYRKV